MKLAVHCAPLVNSCTPGWIVAVAAGAQAWARTAEGNNTTAAAAAAEMARERIRMPWERPVRPNLAPISRALVVQRLALQVVRSRTSLPTSGLVAVLVDQAAQNEPPGRPEADDAWAAADLAFTPPSTRSVCSRVAQTR